MNTSERTVRPGAHARKSLLRGTKDYVAQTISHVLGGEEFQFDIRELSATASAQLAAWPSQAANALGCPLELFSDRAQLGVWLAEQNDPDVGEKLGNEMESLWDIAINDALIDWNLPEPCTDENKALLPRAVKSKLHAAIVGGSNFGVGAEQFFR